MNEKKMGIKDEQLVLGTLTVDARNSLITEFLGNESTEFGPEQVDNPDDVIELERNYFGLQFVKSAYFQPSLSPLERALAPLNQPMHAVTHIGNQFGAKMMPCFMNPDTEAAIKAFRGLSPHTTDEELVLLIRDDQFRDMHFDLHQHLLNHDGAIRQTALERFDTKTELVNPNKGRITANDRYQFNGNETRRSLENMRASGIEIYIKPDSLGIINEVYEEAGDGILPVIELVKNDEILQVNGFDSSKISLAVHDAIDHVWAFDLAERAGLLDKYQLMLDSVGNPETTDIFKREGEIIASIAFGVRYYATTEHGFKPAFHINDILKHVEDLFDEGQLSDRHMEAYRLVRQLGKQPFSYEAQSLGFVYSNYITELNEQRRKHGKIKQRDLRTKKVVGELDPASPDYLSFFVEMHHELLSSHNKHRDNLLRYHILLEEYLSAIAIGIIEPDERLSIRVQEMINSDFSGTTLPPSRINWMNRNYGFSAVRDAII